MPRSGILQRFGLLSFTGLAVDLDGASCPDERAEERKKQLALTLAVESAEADHLAGTYFEADVVQAAPAMKACRP